MRSKFGAIKTTIDGVTFDSKKEAARYQDLKLLLKANQISELELQPKFRLEVNGVKICTYIADFRYKENGKLVTEDVKGVKTPAYNLKKKLVKALYGVEIFET